MEIIIPSEGLVPSEPPPESRVLGSTGKATQPSPPQTGQLQTAGADFSYSRLTSCVLRYRIKPAPYSTGSSHAPFSSGSSNSFNASPEEPAYDGPSTSSAHLAPVVSSTVSYDPRKPTVKSE